MKNFLKIIFLLFFITASFGQKVKFGVKGGINLSNTKFIESVSGEEFKVDYESRISYYIGAKAEFLIKTNNKTPSIQAEIIYSKQGHEYISNSIILIDQINLPILFKQPFINNFSILGGGYLGYLINAQDLNNDTGRKFKRNGYTKFDSGLLVGIEYEFNFGLFLESRYVYGLTDISKVEKPESSIEHNYKNRIFQIGLGYNF